MSAKRYSVEYVQLYKRGPFPHRSDPWAEAGHYFQQIHAGIIGDLLAQIQDPLLEMGYVAGREASLQIAERREPDIYVQQSEPVVQTWDYAAAAAQIMTEPGIAIEGESPDLHAVTVKSLESGELVTVVEIVSPGNKADQQIVAEYQERRERLGRKGINALEIDLTRSVRHLLDDVLVRSYTYHVAVYLPRQLPRVIGVDWGEPLKRVALPLRGEVVPMELQPAYERAYQQASIAAQIHNDGRYHEDELPFPSLLTPRQRREALEAVTTWLAELERLRRKS